MNYHEEEEEKEKEKARQLNIDRKGYAKWSGLGLLINLVFFVCFIFAANYTRHIGHWSQDCFYILAFGSGVTKIVISIIFLSNFFQIKNTEIIND